MNDYQIAELLQRLQDDPTLPLDTQQQQAIETYCQLNQQANQTWHEIKNQRDIDVRLKVHFKALREDMKQIPVPLVSISTIKHRFKGLLLALPIAAMILMAVTAVLWLKPWHDEVQLAKADRSLVEDQVLPSAESNDSKMVESAAPTESNKSKAVVNNEQLLRAKKEQSDTPGDTQNDSKKENFDVSGMNERASTSEFQGSAPARVASSAPNFAAEQPTPADKTKELRQKADALWKKLKANPNDATTKEELKKTLEKLNDKQGLNELLKY